jgi:hypothetical protein
MEKFFSKNQIFCNFRFMKEGQTQNSKVRGMTLKMKEAKVFRICQSFSGQIWSGIQKSPQGNHKPFGDFI